MKMSKKVWDREWDKLLQGVTVDEDWQRETPKTERKSNSKVYCCNCKYFTEGHMDYDLFAMSRSYCNSLTGLVKINPIYGAYNERINLGVSDKSYPNKKGNCKFYKRKWYKFWVK